MTCLKQNWYIAGILGIVFFTPLFAFAHPGRTASDGCHYCRTNCTSWGVPWNERHCHNGYVAPVSTPKPILKLTPKPDTSDNVFKKVEDNKATYYKNPNWYREKLIKDLVKEFGSQYIDIINKLVYTLLPDVKN